MTPADESLQRYVMLCQAQRELGRELEAQEEQWLPMKEAPDRDRLRIAIERVDGLRKDALRIVLVRFGS